MKLSKINLEIINFLEEVNEFVETDHTDDFQVRDGYLVACIKNYTYLDSDDVENYVKKLNENRKNNSEALISDVQLEMILKEFNDERLFGIKSHVNQWEYEDFKEHGNDYVGISKIGYKIDKDDIFTHGRGGWMSFATEGAINFENNENDTTTVAWDITEEFQDETTNAEFNELLEQYDFNFYDCDKYQSLRKYRKEFQEMKDLVSQLKEVEEEIEDLAKNLDYKYQLHHEIDEFINEGIGVEPNAKIDSIVDGTIYTSMGANVPMDSALRLMKEVDEMVKSNDYKELENGSFLTILDEFGDEGISIGRFVAEKVIKKANTIEEKEIDTPIIKIGCHRLDFNACKETIKAKLKEKVRWNV